MFAYLSNQASRSLFDHAHQPHLHTTWIANSSEKIDIVDYTSVNGTTFTCCGQRINRYYYKRVYSCMYTLFLIVVLLSSNPTLSQASYFVHVNVLRRVVKLTSPNLNYFINLGALSLYVTSFIRVTPSTSLAVWKYLCQVSDDLWLKCFTLCTHTYAYTCRH